ncbi:MAG TPA: MopE-related protein, partial [Polyangium sp.]|nr:MopE-related protein [Polyangium sp.]
MRNHRRASLVTLALCTLQLLAGCRDERTEKPNETPAPGSSGELGGGGSGNAGNAGGFGGNDNVSSSSSSGSGGSESSSTSTSSSGSGGSTNSSGSGGSTSSSGAGGSGGSDNPDAGPETRAHFSLRAAEDVASVDFEIRRVSCDGSPIQPFTHRQNVPVGTAGADVLVDLFVLLEPGCYDVVATPLDTTGNPSQTCSPAYYDNLIVVDGTTTEVGLVSQCEGKPMGAADIWLVLNHPPVISGVTFNPDKWVPYCSTQTICVEFTDKDGDPIDIDWRQRSGAPLASGPTELPEQYDPVTGKTTQCATLVHSVPGTVAIEVIAYDLMQAPGGGLMRIEDFYRQLGLPYTSHDSLSFPSHGLSTPSCPCVASTEICDNIDNDCDSQNNEGLSCVCLPFQTVSCYGGPTGTAGVGVCRSGGRTCKFDGSGYNTECSGAVLPSIEQCNGKDDDCDGQTDEGLNCPPCMAPSARDCVYTGPAGTENVGICRAGRQIC